MTNKRKKDSILENIWIRQLACVPNISESIARAIVGHFGSLVALVEALKGSPEAFPNVVIHASGTKLGKARLNKLREVFV